MKISGAGSLPGGDYQEEIHIGGSGKVTGNVSCTEFGISGTGTVLGNLRCSGKVNSSGSGKVKGDLEANDVSTSGAFSVDGGLHCKKTAASGMLQAASVTADAIHVSGMLKGDEDISAEDAVIHGCVESGGLINAEKLEVVFDSGSKANCIGGSSIRIRRKGVVGAAILKFIGKKVFANGDVALSVVKNVEDPETQVDCVTGATLTSNGVNDMLKQGLKVVAQRFFNTSHADCCGKEKADCCGKEETDCCGTEKAACCETEKTDTCCTGDEPKDCCTKHELKAKEE